jgi:hypothetical protein
MRHILFIWFIIFSQFGFAQKRLPVIKALSKEAKIYEGANPAISWNISPEVKPDVFITNKLTKTTTVRFITDSDSIIVKIKPGDKRDFIVLLNGKDSCYTTIQSPIKKDRSAVKPEIHDSIPLNINKQNTMYVLGILNKVDTLQLNFDTGSTALTLTQDALKTKVKSNPKLYNGSHDLQLGTSVYKTEVYDAVLSGHDTDGRFGWNLFDGMIVELNYDKGLMIVHSKMPRQIKKDQRYTKLDINYLSQIFFVEGAIKQNGIIDRNLFVFDTGYQRAIMLDNDLLEQNNFPSDKMHVIKKTIMHGARGNEIPVVTSELEGLNLGKYELKNIPAQLLTTNKPIQNKNAYYLGNEVLKRFNIVLDFQENIVYLKPNKYFDDKYTDSRD